MIDTMLPEDLEMLSQRSFFVPGPPFGKQVGRTAHFDKNGERLFKAKTRMPAKTHQYMKKVAQYYLVECSKLPMMEGAIRMSVFMFYPRPKYHFGTGKNAANIKDKHLKKLPIVPPDRSNVLKILEDPLSGLAYIDDNDIVSGPIEKRYALDPKNIGVMIVLEEVELK